MDILGLIRRLPEIVAYDKFDDDFFDRLNYSHTVAILTVFAIIVTNRQFSENQIKCWVPAQFTGSYEQYVNQICFIKNTYSHDIHQPLQQNVTDRHEHELKYYQWTPFILLLMAILFYIPRQFWRGLSLRSGVDLKDLIEAAQTYRSANVRHEDKIKLLEYLTNWVNNYCSHAYRISVLENQTDSPSKKAKYIRMIHHCFFPIGIYTGNYLIISYLFIKFLYLFNSIGQIFLLNVLLGRDFWAYGLDIIHQYWTKQIGLLYTGNEYFPKIVLCDFSVREPNHPRESHLYTVQCVLPFNLFNQQIFTYLYFWLVILSMFNISSILMWLYRMFPMNNFRYLERRLMIDIFNQSHSIEPDLRHLFVHQYLQGDGTFMLRLVASNVNDYVSTKIISELFRTFRRNFLHNQIRQEPLFKIIPNEDSEEEEDGSTDQTETDIPPLPNPRQGKLFIEEDSFGQSSSENSFLEPVQSRRAVSFSLPMTIDHRQIQLRESPVSFYKDIHQAMDLQNQSSDRLNSSRKNIDFHFEEKITPLSSTPPSISSVQLPSTIIKSPSPYATTYLTTRNQDDNTSNSSISARQTSLQRTHDV